MSASREAEAWVALAEQVKEEQYVPRRHEVLTTEPSKLSYVTASLFLHEWHQRTFECKALGLMLDRIATDIVDALGRGTIDGAINYIIQSYDLPLEHHEAAATDIRRVLESYG